MSASGRSRHPGLRPGEPGGAQGPGGSSAIPAAPDLSAWLATYDNEVRALLRALALDDGFVLHPIELPGPESARALAARLEADGHPVAVIDPQPEGAWRDLVGSLFAVTPPASGVVMVIGPPTETPDVRAALRLLNQRRDVLARHLGAPMIWCGSKEFLDLTWRQAPDFWSVADVPRRFGEAPLQVQPSQHATTRRIREQLASAAGKRWILVTSPESFAVSMRHRVWGRQHEREIRVLSPGDVFFIHVTGGRGLAAMGVFTGEPFQDPTPIWPADTRGTFPWRMRFVPLGELRQGLSTKDVLAPLHQGSPPAWLTAFTQQANPLQPEEFDLLRHAFDAALVQEKSSPEHAGLGALESLPAGLVDIDGSDRGDR